MRYRRQQARSAFTLVEMMVAMTLTIFIMTILSQAFIQGLETFSSLKAIGDLQANLRAASQILRDDLAQQHFTGARRISDLNISSPTPPEGYFIVRAATADVSEGNDTDTIPSYRCNSHSIYFTARKLGNKRDSFFSASCPLTFWNSNNTTFGMPKDGTFLDTNNTGNYYSQWAELGYYLVRTGSTTELLNNTSTLGTPLFALWRKELVVVPDNAAVNAVSPRFAATTMNSDFANIACVAISGDLYFPSPADLATNSAYRSPNNAAHTAGATLLLTNVVSFQVRALSSGGSDFNFGTLDPGPPTTPVAGIEITIRIWDVRSQQTRQTTIIQEL